MSEPTTGKFELSMYLSDEYKGTDFELWQRSRIYEGYVSLFRRIAERGGTYSISFETIERRTDIFEFPTTELLSTFLCLRSDGYKFAAVGDFLTLDSIDAPPGMNTININDQVYERHSLKGVPCWRRIK